MIKFIADEIWALDAEWVPDIPTGRRVYGLGAELDDQAVLQRMYQAGGATEEDPRPYLKTVLCRIVSISALVRRKQSGGPASHQLVSLPRHGEEALPEADLIARFLDGVGKSKPQLVGFNINDADLPILLQRGAASGISARDFCFRPEKPWEGRDYFARNGDWVIDLKQVYGGWGRSTPSLHEIACACRIPGKVGTSGQDVIDLWQEGRISDIVAYNEFDAITTFLLWLRTARLSGLLDPARADEEEESLRGYLSGLVKGGQTYLQAYLDKWDSLLDRKQLTLV